MLVHSVESTGTTCFLPVVYVKDKAVDAVGITGGGLHPTTERWTRLRLLDIHGNWHNNHHGITGGGLHPTTERWTIHLLDIHGTIIIMASLEVVSTLPLNHGLDFAFWISMAQ